MSQIFDRVYRLLRSHTAKDNSCRGNRSWNDSDFGEAWEELEEFLSSNHHSERNYNPRNVPEYLTEDYRTMGLETGVPFSIVREKYIMLVKQLHPDRYAENPVLQAEAEEKMKRINISFEKIKTWETSES